MIEDELVELFSADWHVDVVSHRVEAVVALLPNEEDIHVTLQVNCRNGF